jgi:hypothetical protein
LLRRSDAALSVEAGLMMVLDQLLEKHTSRDFVFLPVFVHAIVR